MNTLGLTALAATSISPEVPVQTITPEQILQYLEEQESGMQYAGATISSVSLVPVSEGFLKGSLKNAVHGLSDDDAYVLATKLIGVMRKKNISGVTPICGAIHQIHIISSAKGQELLFELGDHTYLKRDGTQLLATTIFPPTETLPFDSVQDAQAYTSEYDITTSQTSQEIAEELQNKEERMQSEEERSNEKASVRPSTNHNEDQIAVLQNKLNDHYEEEVEYIEFQPDEGQEKEEGRRKKGEGSMEKREESTLDEQRKEEPGIEPESGDKELPNFSRLGEAISFVTAASDANEAMLDDLETMRFHQVAIEKSLSKSSRIKTVMGIGKEANASKIADFVGKYAQEMESLGAQELVHESIKTQQSLHADIIEVEGLIDQYLHMQQSGIDKKLKESISSFKDRLGIGSTKPTQNLESLKSDIQIKAKTLYKKLQNPHYQQENAEVKKIWNLMQDWDHDLTLLEGGASGGFSVYQSDEQVKESFEGIIDEKDKLILSQELTIDSLYSVIDTLDHLLISYKDTNDKYLRDNTNLQQDVEILKQQLIDAEDEATEFSDALKLSIEEKQVLAETILSLQSDLLDAQTKASFAEQEISKTKQEIDGLSGELRIIHQEKQANEELSDTQSRKLLDAESKIASLSAYIAELEQEREVARGLIKKKIAKINSLTATNESLEGEKSSLMAENLRLQQSLTALNKRISELERDKSSLENSVRSTDANNQELKRINEELEKAKKRKSVVVEKKKENAKVSKKVSSRFKELDYGTDMCSRNVAHMLYHNTTPTELVQLSKVKSVSDLYSEDGKQLIMEGDAIDIFEFNKEQGLHIKGSKRNPEKSVKNAIRLIEQMEGFGHRALLDIQFKNPEKKGVHQGHRILVSVLLVDGVYEYMVLDQSNNKYDDWEKTLLEYYKESGYRGTDITITNMTYILLGKREENIGEDKFKKKNVLIGSK